jgi:hypothetical protein
VQSDRSLGIPGEQLDNVLSARAFVNWYNGHPDFVHLNPGLDAVEDVVVVGNGNVAIDCARILCKDASELQHTDIADHALAALRKRYGPARVCRARPPATCACMCTVLPSPSSQGHLRCCAEQRCPPSARGGPPGPRPSQLYNKGAAGTHLSACTHARGSCLFVPVPWSAATMCWVCCPLCPLIPRTPTRPHTLTFHTHTTHAPPTSTRTSLVRTALLRPGAEGVDAPPFGPLFYSARGACGGPYRSLAA